MQDRPVSGAEHDRKEMIALLNSGDKRELRAFMQLYSKKIYERALDITDDEGAAKDAVRKVLSRVAALAQEGALKENIDVQLMSLTDEICSAPVFAEPLAAPETPASAPAPAAPVQEVPVPAEKPAAPAPVQAAPAEKPAPVQKIVVKKPAPAQAAPAPVNNTAVPLLFEEDDLPRSRAPLAEEEERGASPLLVIGIILLSLVVVFLVWVLVVKMMTTGLIPNYDFGFARWFDSHIFEFYY